MIPGLLSLGVAHWASEPETQIEDAYKWLLHASLGGEHAVKDDSGPRRWLDGEWDGLDAPFPGEPEITQLRPDGLLIRVNLRPYKAAGGDKEVLLQAFVASARRFHADKKEFVAEWRALRGLLSAGPVGAITAACWEKLNAEVDNG